MKSIANLMAIIALALGLAWPANHVRAQAVDARPNILVILADDLGYGDLGGFGHPVIQTPNLDNLARAGMKLTSCYAAAPVCSPSRTGMLTGRTPFRVGVYDWIPDGHPMHLRNSEITVASLLKKAGYATGHFGKWHCNGLFNRPGQPQPGDLGFDTWFSTQNNALPTHHNPRNFVLNGKSVGMIEGFSSQIVTDRAIEWLRQRKPAQAGAEPFMLFVWFHEPHERVASPPRLVEKYTAKAENENQAQYFANVTHLDEQVGRLMATLKEINADQNTFIFFTSDNGPETLKRYNTASRSYGTPGAMRGMKLQLYEGGIRVPGIAAWSGKIAPGTTSDEPVCGVDILPTLCELAGVKPPQDRKLDGQSIAGLLKGGAMERTRPLYWQYDKAMGPMKVALRDGAWKILADEKLQKMELYNLKQDVSEKQDLAAAEPARLAEMAAKLREYHKDVKAEAPVWPDWKPNAPKPAAPR